MVPLMTTDFSMSDPIAAGDAPIRFDTKFVVVVRDDLAVWQKLNVASFLAGGIAGAQPELAGEPYRDGSDKLYGRLVRQPILVMAGTAAEIAAAVRRAKERGLLPSIYTHDLFATGHDAANRAAVAAVATEALDLVGMAVHGDRRDVDKVTKGLKLHP
jgi:hypothetical protein